MEHDESVDFISFNAKSTLLASGDISGKIVCTNLLNKSTLCVVKNFFINKSYRLTNVMALNGYFGTLLEIFCLLLVVRAWFGCG